MFTVATIQLCHCCVNAASEHAYVNRCLCYTDRWQVRFEVGSVLKNLSASARDAGLILGQEDPLEKGMAIQSNTHAWRIPWMEEAGGL